MNKKEKLNDTPWQFEPGDVVYIAGHTQQPAKITAAFGHGRSSWPHYLVVDYEMHEWKVPQQLLSRSPVVA
jgi:hypothetical protein